MSCAQHLFYIMLSSLHLVLLDDKVEPQEVFLYSYLFINNHLETKEKDEVSRKHALEPGTGCTYVNYQLGKKNWWITDALGSLPYDCTDVLIWQKELLKRWCSLLNLHLKIPHFVISKGWKVRKVMRNYTVFEIHLAHSRVSKIKNALLPLIIER